MSEGEMHKCKDAKPKAAPQPVIHQRTSIPQPYWESDVKPCSLCRNIDCTSACPAFKTWLAAYDMRHPLPAAAPQPLVGTPPEAMYPNTYKDPAAAPNVAGDICECGHPKSNHDLNEPYCHGSACSEPQHKFKAKGGD